MKFVLAIALVVVSTSCATVERRLAAAKTEVMAADYRADLSELRRLRRDIRPLTNKPDLGYLAHYWTGFASWRIAINGANRLMPREELMAHLEEARADFDASLRLKTDFADAYAAAASVNGWLATFHARDVPRMREYFARMNTLLARAKELEPDNPRVLWVVGGNFLFAPPAHGGDPKRAIEVYQRMRDLAPERSDPTSPKPDWGRPEAWMSLAFAHFNGTPPDLVSAEKEAREALLLQPEWSYVRDVLMPRIKNAGR
jgi:hypothetical protein